MKVLLIQPPFENMITTNLPNFVDEERGLAPPVGLLYIASYVNEFTDHKVEVLDCSAEKIGYDATGRYIELNELDQISKELNRFILHVNNNE